MKKSIFSQLQAVSTGHKLDYQKVMGLFIKSDFEIFQDRKILIFSQLTKLIARGSQLEALEITFITI